jgi:hypothetical protein
MFNPLKLKLVQIILKNLVRTAQKTLRFTSVRRTQYFTVTKINWLTLFKEMIAINSKNNMKHKTDSSVTGCWSRWDIVTAGLRELREVHQEISIIVNGLTCHQIFLVITVESFRFRFSVGSNLLGACFIRCVQKEGFVRSTLIPIPQTRHTVT